MRNDKITQVLNVARNATRKGFQDGGSPSVLDMARNVMSRMGSDAAGVIKERYINNPSNIPADAAQLAVNLAKRVGPTYAVMEPTAANAGEDEVARQMRMGLRQSPEGYAEEPVNRAKGGRLLQDQFPSKYMPGVGRQVMAVGGSNEPLAEGDHPHWIPTRLVKLAKNRRPNDIVDMDSFRSAPGGFFDKNMALVRNYVNIPADIAKNASNEELAEHFIEHMKANLLDLHDQIPPEIRERSQKWYDGARNITDNWSKKFNLPDYSVAGVLAALSPQMDWYKNVSLAHRTLNIMANHHDDKADDAMKQRFGELVELNSKPKYAALGEFLHGKSLSDIDQLGLPEKERIAAKALWVRLHDETYGDRRHRIITPEGDEGDYVTKGSGDAAGTGWGSFNEIGKAIKSIESKDDPNAISPLMGMKHKVRNFYNNIIAPNSTKGDITADTHAVAAALYRPLSGTSTEVAHNLGTNPPPGEKAASDSAVMGISGTYPLVAEAYRRAAGERNILPRQMQSITWEAIRGMFPATFKNAKNKSEVDKIWQSFKNGELTQEQAREQIRDKALGQGQPIPPPSWFGKGVLGGAGGSNAPAQDSREQGELPRLGALGQPAEGDVVGAGTGSPAPLAEEIIPTQTQPQKFAGGGYVTRQDGPFYRVSQGVAGSDQPGAGRGRQETREAIPSDGGGAGQDARRDQELPQEGQASSVASPSELAQQYVRDVHGREFERPQMPPSSLAKQSAIGRSYAAAVEGSPEYKQAIFNAYAEQMPEVIEQAGASNYDDLLRKSYAQMAHETDQQFRALKGYDFSYHKAGEGDYPSSKHMVDDVTNNKHLFVFQGGDQHDLLNNVDPETGLNENEKFRAVHDLFGHAAFGNQFGSKGEEEAWGVHQQMYSPLARLAMTPETRGQNSFVNYTPVNAELKESINRVEEKLADARRNRSDTSMYDDQKKKLYSQFQFAPNKAVLLPPEFLSTEYSGGMPSYMKDVIRPAEGTGMSSKLTHFSNEPDLTETDPSRYGTGIKGDEASRLRSVPGAVKDRSYFYLGEPEAVTPEEGLGQHRYEATAENLYNLAEDPLKFKTLAREANRQPWSSNFNPGTVDPNRFSNDLERLAKEHGYSGVANPNAAFPMAAMFEPTPVTPRADGGGLNADDIPSIDNPISVFPKPQRMYSDEDRVPGGQYLDAKTKADLTGKKAAMASIGINPGGKPYFNASPDNVDETGSPGKGSAITKANLFKQKAGWKWVQTPDGHEDTSTVVSVAHRGDHHYALNAHFPKGVDFARYENASSEPRLRPTTRGNIIKGDQVGSISVRGKEHPVYDHIIVKAAGGAVDNKHNSLANHGNSKSIVDKALMLTSRKA